MITISATAQAFANIAFTKLSQWNTVFGVCKAYLHIGHGKDQPVNKITLPQLRERDRLSIFRPVSVICSGDFIVENDDLKVNDTSRRGGACCRVQILLTLFCRQCVGQVRLCQRHQLVDR